jgi:hypothetical protein
VLTTAPEEETGLTTDSPPYIISLSNVNPENALPSEDKPVKSAQDQIFKNDITAPTEQDLVTLRRVSGKIPLVAYSLCIVEFAERASYYGCTFVFSNFVQFPLP